MLGFLSHPLRLNKATDQEMFPFTFFCLYCNTNKAVMHSTFCENFIEKNFMKASTNPPPPKNFELRYSILTKLSSYYCI